MRLGMLENLKWHGEFATVVAFCDYLCYIAYDRKWKIKNKM